LVIYQKAWTLFDDLEPSVIFLEEGSFLRKNKIVCICTDSYIKICGFLRKQQDD